MARLFPVLTCLLFALFALAAEPGADLADYRTVATALAAPATVATVSATPRQAGYLGLHLVADAQGRLTVAEVSAHSPAALAGVQRGDILDKLNGTAVKQEDVFRDLLRTKSAGEVITLHLTRKDRPVEATATLVPLSRPMPLEKPRRAMLGVQVAGVKEGEGVTIERVFPGSAAEKAKLKTGEVLLKIDDVSVTSAEKLREVMADKKPDDTVKLTLLLAEKAVDLKMKLGTELLDDGRSRSWDTRGGYWSKPAYRLGIICVEYPDLKHNPKIPVKVWEEAMFSKGSYTQNSATGQPVFGSLYDYYLEQSYGQLKVEGKAFEYVEVSKKRAAYATGDRTALLTEALDKVLARDGKDALKDYDGVFFLYAGDRFPASRGSLYWPHRASVSHNGRRWAYFICPEGGARMANISVFCHEFGHMLGLPDLYARPENPGMEGLGVWCAMANQVGNGRPQHFCAWSKERLGWIKPAVIDPAMKQKLILSPIEDSPKECFKIPLRPNGSEYLLLENRGKKGYDQSLPAHGLLIWRVVGNRPILEEAHGIEGASGPRVFVGSVPYPSSANDAFTPFTTPSSRSQLGGGLPVYLTNIRRLDDGRITFHVGYEYQ